MALITAPRAFAKRLSWPIQKKPGQLRTVRELRKAVEDARAKLLKADGTVKEGYHKTKVSCQCDIEIYWHDIMCLILCYITWSSAG